MIGSRDSGLRSCGECFPEELLILQERIRSQPAAVRAELEPLVEEALEDARFRGRVLLIAREALGRFRLELKMLAFDLEATKREGLRRCHGEGE
jgi:hypothetical protein